MLRCVEGEDKVNADKSKVMVMNGEEGLECEFHIDGVHFRVLCEHCLYLFLCMAVRQCYGRRRRYLGLGLAWY